MAEILVVEDDEDLSSLEQQILETAGHRVETTASGREAVLLSARKRFDLVLLDVDVEELSGDAVASVIRDLGRSPILAISGRLDPWRRRMLDLGATACLSKPFSIDTLLRLVRSVLIAGKEKEECWPTGVEKLSDEDLARIGSMDSRELDELPFGVIALGADGRIEEYNDFEEESSSYWAPTVIGHRFEEIAPCTRVREFAGAVERGLRGEELDEVLRFVFPYERALCLVNVRLYRDPRHQRVWVFVSRRIGEPDSSTMPA